MDKLTSDLGREYARALRASSLSEIASWCEMAHNGLTGRDEAASDREIYRAAALSLRALQEAAA